MVRISFDSKAQEYIAAAPHDGDAAARVLVHFAQLLRRREQIPGNLADYIADAIEASMGKPTLRRAKAFTDELHLTTNNRRPADWHKLGAKFAELLAAGCSETRAALTIADDFNVSTSTARKCWREYERAKTAHDDIV